MKKFDCKIANNSTMFRKYIYAKTEEEASDAVWRSFTKMCKMVELELEPGIYRITVICQSRGRDQGVVLSVGVLGE